MHLRPFLEPNEIAPAEGICANIGVCRDPNWHKDAVQLNGQLVQLPQNSGQSIRFTTPFDKRKLKGFRVNIKGNSFGAPKVAERFCRAQNSVTLERVDELPTVCGPILSVVVMP